MAEDPFEPVVAAHHGEIRRYLLRVTGRASDADDLSQETFLRAFRAHRGLAPGTNLRAWLFAIATNLSRNHFRAAGRRRRAYAAAAGAAAGTDAASPDGVAAAGEARARLEALIGALPLKQRLAFVMRKMHDLDYPAIADGLGCSAESARAHVFQAMRKLRQGLVEGPRAAGEPRP